ncbi:MAG: NAD(P)H-dependent oxidoreductase [Acidobacteria bacterium]|nr:NAD(P)H-dependent oxidoreductase [Acidobacteriota bacterium]MDA1234492.1 NAD(P)H-dependent oxidoreductase [Acidobacteriota bacterium]
MTKILGISGSLRAKSFNSMLLHAAAQTLEEGAELEVGSIRGIPLFDQDVEDAEGVPQVVEDLKARVLACDGLLLATPEYNNGIPGAFKNALDWLSRPPEDTAKVFKNRPVAIVGASPGGFGTILAQNAWLPVVRALGMRPYFGGRLVMSHAHRAFDDDGEMTDAVTKDRLRDFMRGFVEFTGQNSR